MDFFKFILCLDQIEIVCVVPGPCWCSIFESLRVQMLWETWDSFHPLREKLPHSSHSGAARLSRLWWLKLQLFILCSLKAGGEREGGWEEGRWKDHNARKATISQTWKDLFYSIVSGRKPSCLWGERNYQKKLFKKFLFPAYHTGLPCLDFICLFFKELV